MVDTVPVLTEEKNVALFEKYRIYSRAELESRAEVMYETYTKTKSIEARTMVHMAGKHYVPAVVRFIARLSDSVNKARSACPDADVSVQQDLIRRASKLLSLAYEAENRLDAAIYELGGMEDVERMAHFCRDVICLHMKDLRSAVDRLEMIVDKDLWPVPTYGDLMFEV